MFQSIFRNMQPVVKNLLIINALFFLATFIFEKQGIDLSRHLSLYYVSSNAFQPYQILTSMFMHSNITHIIFNMFGLVFFGNMLERVWGGRRFLVFYFITGIGATLLHQFVQGIELYQLTGTFFPTELNEHYEVLNFNIYQYDESVIGSLDAIGLLVSPGLGASGAVFGLLAGVGMYFPNTEVLLYFTFRVKLKWLALGYAAFEIIQIVQNNPKDHVAHFAHLGGALFGYILIKIWERNKSNFY